MLRASAPLNAAGGANYDGGHLDADGDVDLPDLARLLVFYGETRP